MCCRALPGVTSAPLDKRAAGSGAGIQAHLCLGVAGGQQLRESDRAVGVAEDEAAGDLARDVLQCARRGRRDGGVVVAEQPHQLRDAVAAARTRLPVTLHPDAPDRRRRHCAWHNWTRWGEQHGAECTGAPSAGDRRTGTVGCPGRPDLQTQAMEAAALPSDAPDGVCVR